MSRQSAHREDLMAEVITLTPRVALHIPEFTDVIVAGRRTDGRWSIFFGGDPVYHFDDRGRLRRAFVADRLYRSQGTTLARLTREESAEQTVLLRHDLNSAELLEFQHRVISELRRLLIAISENRTTIEQAEPPEIDFRPELASLIQIVIDSNCQLSAPLKRG